MKAVTFLLSLSTLCSSVAGLGQKATVTTTSASGLLQLGGNSLDSQILLSSNDWWGVLRVAQDLAIDFGKVTGKNLTLANYQSSSSGSTRRRGSVVVERGWSSSPQNSGSSPSHSEGDYGGDSHQNPPGSENHNHNQTGSNGVTVYYNFNPVTSFVNYTVGPTQNFTGPTLLSKSSSKTVIIAGTIGKSDVINALVASGKLNITSVSGQWESFISTVVTSPLPGVDKALVIAGSDLRGTIFGLYDISEQIGVSPWWWWADVPVKTQSGVWALGETKIQLSPSVKYRGIFINDEQPALTNWINVNYAPGKYGPGFNHYFHSHVFELLLRLRANYFWPAMWNSMYNVDDTANQPLADAYGIVMGSSHTEPMARASNEWGNFGPQYGGNGKWAFNSNNASIIPFFTYGAERAKPYATNTLFTMAMRGVADTALLLTPADAIVVLQDVIAAQRDILTTVFNGTKITDIPQMWCLYSEVQGYYENQGLTVPEDITLLWADDNYGNVRRLPLANETSRIGGAGVYYHIDYVGDVRAYKWINTIQLEKTVHQMQLAYARQADRIWILNVGDLKPLEIPINHFLDLAYDTSKWDYDSVPTWLKLWATREFGAEHADTISSIMDRYGMYAMRRKYELLDPYYYSVINYNEGDAILAEWQALATDAQAVYDSLGADYLPAFYEMILQPVLGGQAVHQIYINAAKNSLYAIQKRNAANSVVQDVLDSFKQDAVLTKRYHDLLGGKWNHMLDQTHLGYSGYWQQPMRNILPPLSYVQELEDSLAGNIGVGVEASNATVSGDDAYHTNSGWTLVTPPLDPFGPKTRYFDVFGRGTGACHWNATTTATYLTITPSSGYTGGADGKDIRVYLSVDWKSAPAAPNTTTVNINIQSSCGVGWGNYNQPIVQVPISNLVIPSAYTGFVESDKTISIEAEHISSSTNTSDGIGYTTLPGLGRTLSGVTLVPVLAPTQTIATGPYLAYNIYTFTNTSVANVTLFLSPSLNANGPIRTLKYAIAIDSETPKTVQPVPAILAGSYFPPNWGGAASDSVWGGVASGKTTTTTHDLSKTGEHVLKIWLLEPALVVQKIIIDLGGVRLSYLGPPESFRAGIDTTGTYDGTNFAGIKL